MMEYLPMYYADALCSINKFYSWFNCLMVKAVMVGGVIILCFLI